MFYIHVKEKVRLFFGFPETEEDFQKLGALRMFEQTNVAIIGTSPTLQKLVTEIGKLENSLVTIYTKEEVPNDTQCDIEAAFRGPSIRFVRIITHTYCDFVEPGDCNAIFVPLTADGILSAVRMSGLDYGKAREDARLLDVGKFIDASQWGFRLDTITCIINDVPTEAERLLRLFMNKIESDHTLQVELFNTSQSISNAKTILQELRWELRENKTELAKKGVYLVDKQERSLHLEFFRNELQKKPELHFVVLRKKEKEEFHYSLFTPENGKKIEERCPVSSDIGMMHLSDDHFLQANQEAWEQVILPALMEESPPSK